MSQYVGAFDYRISLESLFCCLPQCSTVTRCELCTNINLLMKYGGLDVSIRMQLGSSSDSSAMKLLSGVLFVYLVASVHSLRHESNHRETSTANELSNRPE